MERLKTNKPGIYAIRSPSGRCYVGSAKCLRSRSASHIRDLEAGKHSNQKLQRAWEKYGAALQIEVLEFVQDPTGLVSAEQRWIDRLDCVRNGYNIAPTAGSMLGFKQDRATVERLAAMQRGRKAKPGVGDKISAALRGVPKSEEHRTNAGFAQRGKIVSAETRAKQSAARRGKRRGPHSAETRERIRVAHLGRVRGPQSPLHLERRIAAIKQAYALRFEKMRSWMFEA